MTAPSPLCVVPAHLRTREELDVLLRCLVSLWSTAGAPDALVVDDGSPDPGLVSLLAPACAELGFELHVKPVNEGFARTVNVGLERALADGRDAVLIHADVAFDHADWLERMLARTDTQGRLAAVVGARLRYPNGCLEHAGLVFSSFERRWWHRCAHAPAELPEALAPLRAPVSGALQLIRHDTLAQVGLYDGDFRRGGEDVDYCLRVFAAGLECIYEPAATAVHRSAAPADGGGAKLRSWQVESAERLRHKWRTADLSPFTPELV